MKKLKRVDLSAYQITIYCYRMGQVHFVGKRGLGQELSTLKLSPRWADTPRVSYVVRERQCVDQEL